MNIDLLNEEKQFVMENNMLKSIENENMMYKLNQEKNPYEILNMIYENLIREEMK